jgi:hypothetical protein
MINDAALGRDDGACGAYDFCLGDAVAVIHHPS